MSENSYFSFLEWAWDALGATRCAQQCYKFLRWNVACVWSGLKSESVSESYITAPNFTRFYSKFFVSEFLHRSLTFANKQLGAAYTRERRMRFETNYFLPNSTQDMIFSVVAVTLRSKSLHRGLSTSRAHNTTARTTSQLSQKVLLLECLKKHNLSNAIKARLLNCLKKYNFSHFLKGTTSNILKNPNSRMS